MGIFVCSKINMSILFGLGVCVKAAIKIVVEVHMNNSFVILTCVWYEVAFLRGLGGCF